LNQITTIIIIIIIMWQKVKFSSLQIYKTNAQMW
jgi:hypothetical protein